MTPAQVKVLDALPVGAWRPVRWVLHRAQLSHGVGTEAVRDLVTAGRLEAHPDAGKGDWRVGAALVRKAEDSGG